MTFLHSKASSSRVRVTLPAIALLLGERKTSPKPPAQKLTPRATMVLAFIEAKPGMTVLEYSDLVIESTEFINLVLTNTSLGNWLTRNGKVAVTTVGGLPLWYRRMSTEQRGGVPIRDPEPQLKLQALPKGIKGAARKSWDALGTDIVKFVCRPTSSPKIRIQRLAEISAHMKTGIKREIEAQKTIVQLQLGASAAQPVAIAPLALPRPQSGKTIKPMAPKKTVRTAEPVAPKKTIVPKKPKVPVKASKKAA